jgi:uroporphyrinogen-III synthase
MRILITRPQDDSEATAAHVRALGHEAVLSPLMAVTFADGPDLDLSGVQAIAATSANGVRAVARRTKVRALPLFAVGSQTAESARQSGFARVENAHGDSLALARLLEKSLEPANGAIFHATGNDAPGTLATDLQSKGFVARREILYATPAAKSFSPEASAALENGSLDAVLFYSSRTAEIFCGVVKQTGMQQACEKLVAVCISDASAGTLSTLNFREIRVANAPNQDALLACLG